MPLFTCNVENIDDWAEIYDRSEPFEQLTRHILALHSLPQGKLGKTTPGSHAVFHVGEVIVKIFAPDTVGWDCEADFNTEITAMRRAESIGVPVPKLIACGRVMDKYLFRYIIMEFIHGIEFGKAKLSDDEKFRIGQRMREVCDLMNKPCEPCGIPYALTDARRSKKWLEFPESFNEDRQRRLASYPFGEPVYVHGDIHADNVIYTDSGGVVMLDFADSMIAPVSYEYAALIPGLFAFEKPFLDGFFGNNWDADELAELLTEGLLLHRFGANIVIDRDINPAEVTSAAVLREKVRGLLPD